MNDEIKEILNFSCNADYKRLSCDEIVILRDYITNLQQKENQYDNNIKMLNDIIKQQDGKLNELQQENERLKLEIERLNDVLVHKPDEKITLKTQDGKEMFIIQSERIDMQEELNKTNMQLMTQLEDYKSRCEKAVEYIKDNSHNNYYSMLQADYNMSLDTLLDILNGRSDE